MGSLFGGLLTELGWNVTLYDVWREHVDAMNERGLCVNQPDGTERSIPVRAVSTPAQLSTPDLAVVFVKCTQTRSAMADVGSALGPETTVLTLQNGFRNPEVVAEYVPERRVVAGVTEASADLEGPGQITHTGTGVTTIGRYFGPNDGAVRAIAEGLTEAGIEATVTSAVRDAIWKKALVNVAYNAVAALSRERVGGILDSPAGRQMIEDVVTEAVAVARARGRSFDEDPVEYVFAVGEESRTHAPSMLQDIQAGRRTEIEFLNGSVVGFAEQHDVAVPVNRTLARLVRLAEEQKG